MIPEVAWQSLASVPTMPEVHQDFFGEDVAIRNDARRSFARLPLRGRALSHRGSEVFGVYTLDLSAAGIAVYAPVQLFPLDRLKIIWDVKLSQDVLVRRCRRQAENCYLIGGSFVDGPLDRGELRELLDLLAKLKGK